MSVARLGMRMPAPPRPNVQSVPIFVESSIEASTRVSYATTFRRTSSTSCSEA
jgi:hypothetical protein